MRVALLRDAYVHVCECHGVMTSVGAMLRWGVGEVWCLCDEQNGNGTPLLVASETVTRCAFSGCRELLVVT
jgi:hypothetical protein